MDNLLDGSPLYLPNREPRATVLKDKGKQIMEGLLLEQYQNSPNLKEYYMAFISELDLLFEQVELVHLSRFIENAVGVQQDVLGIILQQSRAVILPTIWFGFEGAVNVDGMADEETPTSGGLFRDENLGQNSVTPLDDLVYRRVLLAKATMLNRDSIDLPLAYYVISILLGRVPSMLNLISSDSDALLEKRRVDLRILRNSVTNAEIQLIYYMSKYFVPSGITFTITQVD